MLPGLTTLEARERLKEFGPNIIVERSRSSLVELFARQFISPLILILVAAALISLFSQDSVDAGLIFLIVVLNGILGFWQEYKAEKLIQALKSMSNPTSRVIRDGSETEVSSSEVVPGDVVTVAQGDKVPADGRVLESADLEVNESALTGESAAVLKEAQEGSNQLYLGTSIVKGRAKYEVTATGMNSRFGRIALKLKSIKDEETPLEKELTLLGKKLGFTAIGGSVLIFILGVASSESLREMFFTSVSMAVAAVPEGLPAIVTITLAVGVQRMSRRKSIIRKMSAIEALGAVEIICTDKTGTLTKNEMSVRKIWLNSRSFEAGKKEIGLGDPHFTKLLRVAVNANTAKLVYKKDHGSFDILGDQMEGALLEFSANSGVDPERLREEFKLVGEFSFDASVRTMSVVGSFDHSLEAFVKGAPEVILRKSRYLLLNNKRKPLNTTMKEELRGVYEKYAQEGLRVLAFAYKEVEGKGERKFDRSFIESELTLIGFVGIADPPRPEVRNAITKANEAGIRTVLVTGDNELTAASIASEIGLLKEGEDVLTGAQMEKMAEGELLRMLDRVRVFARSSPENKLRIVELFQKKGYTTAVTGDGVNDALALKKADVGVAMGISGTDVAKEASDMIIADDNYASVVSAVEEGRVIYDNIVKGVRFLLFGNLSELGFLLLSLIFSLPVPLYPVQILWINLVTDGLPALALSVDPKDPLVMNRPPRDKSRKVSSWAALSYPLLLGLITAVVCVIIYALVLKSNTVNQARSASFTLLILIQLFLIFFIRRGNILNNRFLVLTIFITLGLQFLILTVPTLQYLFKVEPFW